MRADELTAEHRNRRVKFNSPFNGVIIGRIVDIYDSPGFVGPVVFVTIADSDSENRYDTYSLDGGVEMEMIE